MVAMLETATGVKAFSVGKPSPLMMRAARKELGLVTAETTMIGDTMETDILGAVQLGFHSVLVRSGGGGGGAPHDDIGRYSYQPDRIVDSIADLHEMLNERDWQPWWLSMEGLAEPCEAVASAVMIRPRRPSRRSA